MHRLATITLALASALPAAAQPVTYSVLDLGPGAANAINALGQVAGTSNNMAVRWEANGQVTPLGTLGGTKSEGLGINASGQVVGDSVTGTGPTHAFVTTGGGFPVMTDLGTLGGHNGSTGSTAELLQLTTPAKWPVGLASPTIRITLSAQHRAA